MKSFLDATGALWATGALSGKFVGTFFSTASQHGGQETTAYTLLTYFAHHGLNYIPLGYPNSHMFDNDEVVGGSPYGAGTVANGDGSRLPTDKEKDIAKTQGELFAKLLNTYHRGLEIVKKENSKSTADSAVANATEPSTTPAPVQSSSAGKEETAAPTTEEPQKSANEPIAPVSETTRQVDENPTTSNNNGNKNVPKSASKTKSKKEKKSSKCFCM
ncbi:Putative NAD(P)H:quinone oxidoreductase, type IV [Rhizopus microsporus]|nr:Putative NAD(P)H:quinone oxidoreductase, type IV [Rhizopus microsporus]